MERVILFRGKSKDTGEWVFGDLYTGLNNELYINTVVELTASSRCNKQIMIHKETLGQFINYEDNEGVKTFEGDKVVVKYAGKIREGVILFDDRTNAFVVSIKDSMVLVPFGIVDSLLVIGTINE